MAIFFTIITMIASILLILLVLVQNPKGGGFSTDFGSASQLGGVKQTNNFIENATWSLAGIIGVMSIIMALMYHQPNTVPTDNNQQGTEQPIQQDSSSPAADDVE